MDPVIGTQRNRPLHGSAIAVSASSSGDLDAVLRDTRQQFAGAFASHGARLMAAIDHRDTDSSSADAIATLHRMTGLAGTIGFPTVSIKAAELEAAFSVATSSTDLLAGLAALQRAFEQDVMSPSVNGLPQNLPTMDPLTVLLVEDEPVQRAVLVAQLRNAGHTSVAVASGEEALAVARNARPDVILLDVELPGMNGYDACRSLKADPALAGIPVAFLSAHAELDARLTGLSFGADDFLVKPIDARELALRLQLLSKRVQRSSDQTARNVLAFEIFRAEAATELRRHRGVLALIRTPPDRVVEVSELTRDEIRRRDLCAQYDRTHVVVLLPDTSGAAGRERIASIVEQCRANGIGRIHAGLAPSPSAGGRTLEQLLEEADDALAIARYEDVPAALRPDGPRAEAQTSGLSPLVLVGDDDPDVVRIVDAHLAAADYRRILTFDGSRTLEEVRAQRPDVLVLDLMMPRMTGFDVLAGLREMGDARPQVIVLSARGREEDVMRAFSLGADDFMVKPFNPQELLARIARLVKSAD